VGARHASGGSVNLAALAPQTFQPLLGLLQQRIAQLSGSRITNNAWSQVCQHDFLRTLLQETGLVDAAVHEEQLGYHLRDAQEWWEVVWHSSLRMLVEQAPEAQRNRLRTEHLAEVASLATANGLWLDVPVLFARGHKPMRAMTVN
jgi:hypothetical protein